MIFYSFPPSMRQLVNELSKLPSVGEKSAVRLAYHLLTEEKGDALTLATTIRKARENIGFCEVCFSLTERERCSVCDDDSRSRQTICVVEKPIDIVVLERSRSFSGLYHVLHGLWAPLRGVAPESTKIHQLLERVKSSFDSAKEDRVQELILATGTTVEGDATALYIANALADYQVTVTRIAQGLPKGGELEYADEVTLSHAIEGRQGIEC